MRCIHKFEKNYVQTYIHRHRQTDMLIAILFSKNYLLRGKNTVYDKFITPCKVKNHFTTKMLIQGLVDYYVMLRTGDSQTVGNKV